MVWAGFRLVLANFDRFWRVWLESNMPQMPLTPSQMLNQALEINLKGPYAANSLC